jgi:hypothetical protein
MALAVNVNKGTGIIHVTGTTDVPVTLYDGAVRISEIWWSGATAGDKVSLITLNNKPIWGCNCAFSDDPERATTGNKEFSGIKCNDMDSGELYLYVSFPYTGT